MLFSKIQLSKARPFILIVLSIFLFIHQSIAQCNSQIGELKVLNFQHEDGIFICYNDTLKVEVEGYELVDSQKLYYVYHTDRDNFDLTLKVDTVNTIGLINNSYPYNVKLYATAIVAKLNENNSFSISDSCAVFSNTLEFIFLESIVVEHKLKCIRGSDQKYDITFYLTGGLPKLDSMYTYFITGDYNSFGTNAMEIKLLDQDNYFVHISAFDENGCINTFSKPIDCSRLPISLLSFEGIRNKDGHLLKWITAAEIENDYFLLEVSKDAINFEVLDTIDGAGTTANLTKYSFLHEDISPGRYLYKLSKVDFEGELSVDGYVELIAFAPNLFPNPTHANLSFHQQEMLTNLSIQIFDLSGKRVLSFDETQIRKNTLGFKIDVSVLSGGIYFAQLRADELERIEKFVVEK